MKKNIERALFWFKDGEIMLSNLNEQFFGLSMLLTRLLNEHYSGKKLRFINLEFVTEKTSELYPSLAQKKIHYYGGDLRCFIVFDLHIFLRMEKHEQFHFLWKQTEVFLKYSGEFIKNIELVKSAETVYQIGEALNYNTDLKVLETDLVINKIPLKALLIIKFSSDYMFSELNLINSIGKVVFKKLIDKSRNGIEFFLEMYQNIKFDSNNIIIEGVKDARNLPVFVPLLEIQNEL